MKKRKKVLVYILLLPVVLYMLALVLVYFFQEKLLFHPVVTGKDEVIELPEGIAEEYITMADGIKLHGLLARNKNSKGLVFYLHGNGGNAFSWGESIFYAFPKEYDLFVLDYRGYGRSEGAIKSERQMMDDVTTAFDYITKKYSYTNVVVDGYSIGTGPATQLAATRNIKALILQAPYYSLTSLIDSKVPLLPGFMKKYTFETCNYISKVKAPVYIFHGKEDALIPFENSEKLHAQSKISELIPLSGVGHNGINESLVFSEKVTEILK
ncbi:MAG: alpha/beta fold hydrolase [Bacteroidota bacterium]